MAGQRAGLSGQRSSLWFEFERILSELRPRWCVVENVPGLLSSNAGRDFARILMGLGELGYGWAYRVLDARWFGVPQRRRRVFVVGCLGDQARAQAVLAVCESCGGHPASRGAAGQDVAGAIDDSVDEPGNLYAAEPDGVSRPLVARESGYRMDLETENFLVANTLRAGDGHHGHSMPRGDGTDNLWIGFDKDGSGTPGKSSLKIVEDGVPSLLSVRPHAVAGTGVRRLTPRECNRLQGFPDDWDRYGADGKEIADSHRYRCMGNAVCVPVAEWLGHRLIAADAW